MPLVEKSNKPTVYIYQANRFFPALPSGHRFPMAKYQLVMEQLVYEGTFTEDQFIEAPPLPSVDALRVHTPRYWHAVLEQRLDKKESRKLGFPQSGALVQRARRSAMGTLLAARDALNGGIGLNLGGGTHHGYADHGEGFSVFNDMAIAARYLLHHRLVSRLLFVDLDVHQGNGNAWLFRDDPAVFTFSMHCASNYPLHKENSDLDVALPAGTGDDAYFTALSAHWPRLLEEVHPNLVFYQSGVDVLAGDCLGHFGLSLEACQKRDEWIMQACQDANIPLVVVMGGGYNQRLALTVAAHAATYRLAASRFDGHV